MMTMATKRDSFPIYFLSPFFLTPSIALLFVHPFYSCHKTDFLNWIRNLHHWTWNTSSLQANQAILFRSWSSASSLTRLTLSDAVKHSKRYATERVRNKLGGRNETIWYDDEDVNHKLFTKRLIYHQHNFLLTFTSILSQVNEMMIGISIVASHCSWNRSLSFSTFLHQN